MKKPLPKTTPLQEGPRQPELFLVAEEKPSEKPCCGNCSHRAHRICNLVLPRYIRTTDRMMDRMVNMDDICSFHSP